MDSIEIKVNYTVSLNKQDKDRLFNLAKEYGYDYNDAGPMLAIKRLLSGVGIEGCFPESHQLNARYSIEE